MHRLSFVNDLIKHTLIDQRQLLLRGMIVVSVLILSVAIAHPPLHHNQQRILGLILVIGVVLVFLHKPPLGITALIPASLIIPFSIGTGTNTSINITVILLTALIGLWLLDMVVRQRHLRLVRSSTVLPLLLFILVAIMSFGFGQLPWFSSVSHAPLRAQLGGLAIFLLSAGAFLLVACQVNELTWLQRLTWLFLAIGGIIAVGRLIPVVGGFTGLIVQRGADGSLFWIWLVALALSQAVFNQQLDTRSRLLLIGIVLSVFYINMFQGRRWSSGWIPPLVSAVVILWAASPRLGLLAVFGASLVAAQNWQSVTNFVMVGDNQYSLMTRLEAWQIVAGIVGVNPILGLGPANYYWYAPLFPIMGYSVSFSSHNNFVDIVAQTGLLGLACFVWFAWELGRLGWQLRARVPVGFPQAYVYGALGGLVGTLAAGMFGDWVLPFVYNIGLKGFRASALGWLFMGGLVALGQMTRSSKNGSGTVGL